MLLRQRLDLGVKAVVMGNALSDWAVIRENPDATVGNIVVDSYFSTVNTKESKLLADWEKRYKGSDYPVPTSTASREYIGISFVIEGIRKAGSVEAQQTHSSL